MIVVELPLEVTAMTDPRTGSTGSLETIERLAKQAVNAVDLLRGIAKRASALGKRFENRERRDNEHIPFSSQFRCLIVDEAGVLE